MSQKTLCLPNNHRHQMQYTVLWLETMSIWIHWKKKYFTKFTPNNTDNCQEDKKCERRKIIKPEAIISCDLLPFSEH